MYPYSAWSVTLYVPVCGVAQTEGSALIFLDTQISLQHSVGQVEGSLHAKPQLDSSGHFVTIGRMTDRRTRDYSLYRTSIASRGKSVAVYKERFAAVVHTSSCQSLSLTAS